MNDITSFARQHQMSMNFDHATHDLPELEGLKQTSSSQRKASKKRVIRFIDLFAGMGGTRVGFEQACQELKLACACVFTSEIKPHALKAYALNFGDDHIAGDITAIEPEKIPNFDYLLGGFPCQPFSSAGKRLGLKDDRGNLFFNILEILRAKKPTGFLLENVDGLAKDNDGHTIAMIEAELQALGYQVSWAILDASDFAVPQQRRRLYIAGHVNKKIDLTNFEVIKRSCGESIERNAPIATTPFAKLLREHYSAKQLEGKSIKDKRGGSENIHSWDIEYKGPVSSTQKKLLNQMLTQRRQKKWAIAKGMAWMDGMPLTLDEIASFFPHPKLKAMLDDLVVKGYVRFEHPKALVDIAGTATRRPDPRIPKGYNIVTGKLSFPLTKILHPEGIAPTLVATEAGKLGVSLPNGVRAITVREGLRLSGFPDSYQLDHLSYKDAFDLLGNTVMPPVICAVVQRILAV
jgi:DNA (cytosine-5)-methyltransferase 1